MSPESAQRPYAGHSALPPWFSTNPTWSLPARIREPKQPVLRLVCRPQTGAARLLARGPVGTVRKVLEMGEPATLRRVAAAWEDSEQSPRARLSSCRCVFNSWKTLAECIWFGKRKIGGPGSCSNAFSWCFCQRTLNTKGKLNASPTRMVTSAGS